MINDIIDRLHLVLVILSHLVALLQVLSYCRQLALQHVLVVVVVVVVVFSSVEQC